MLYLPFRVACVALLVGSLRVLLRRELLADLAHHRREPRERRQNLSLLGGELLSPQGLERWSIRGEVYETRCL